MRPTRLLIAPLAAATLSACVVAPYPGRTVYREPLYNTAPAYGVPDDSVVVDVAPPAPYVEVVPPVPFAGAIWINGYWGWNGGRHTWQRGHWERPRPGYTYRPHAWVQQGSRWYLRGGTWVHR